jgi:plasmid stabilization system protein ParE
MPEHFRVNMTAEALEDLEGIRDFIARHSPDTATLYVEKMLAEIAGLDFIPNRYKKVGESRKWRSPVHAMVFNPYIVYYRIEVDALAVYILTIRHGARLQPRRFP